MMFVVDLGRKLALPLLMLCASISSGCGLYDEIPDFEGRACGSPCGPCGLGRWECDGDERCSLDLELVPERAQCGGSSAQVLVVDPEAGQDGADGSVSAPLKGLDQALSRKPTVIFLVGNTKVKIEKPWSEATSLIGGFVRNPEGELDYKPSVKPLIEGFSQDLDAFGLFIEAKGAAISFENVRIQAPASQRHSYGILAVDAKLRLDNVQVLASDAAPGLDGLQGDPGADGVEGQRSSTSSGGRPGIQSMCMDSVGGAGGIGQARGATTRDAASGKASMLGARGGAPGVSGQNGTDGQNGEPGQDATQGFVQGTRFVYGVAATAGQNGASGVGGGGGGGGLLANGATGEAQGGGGGGAGGCGGQGGAPGLSGGSSFGVLLIKSTLVAQDSEFVSAQAGLGGQGAAGGQGGKGAMGGPSDGQSGRGGQGGQGGAGGAGGDGHGGLSVALYCEQSSAQLKNVQTKFQPSVSVEANRVRSSLGVEVLNCAQGEN